MNSSEIEKSYFLNIENNNLKCFESNFFLLNKNKKFANEEAFDDYVENINLEKNNLNLNYSNESYSILDVFLDVSGDDNPYLNKLLNQNRNLTFGNKCSLWAFEKTYYKKTLTEEVSFSSNLIKIENLQRKTIFINK